MAFSGQTCFYRCESPLTPDSLIWEGSRWTPWNSTQKASFLLQEDRCMERLNDFSEDTQLQSDSTQACHTALLIFPCSRCLSHIAKRGAARRNHESDISLQPLPCPGCVLRHEKKRMKWEGVGQARLFEGYFKRSPRGLILLAKARAALAS